MTFLNFLTLNVRGLNSPVKRIKCLDYLKRKNVDIAFIQETHLKSSDVNRFQNKNVKVLSSSSASNKTKGTLIVVRRRLELTLRTVGSDNDGRFCYAVVTLKGSKFCLASIYAPNTFNTNFFNSIKSTLLNFSDSILILAGDFNLIIDPVLDTTKHDSSFRKPASLYITTFLEELNIIDAWRQLNPSTQDYTYFSARHSSYSRIDFFFISPALLKYNAQVTILPMLLSDHSPISFSLQNFSETIRCKRWRFNTTLLQNKDFLIHITESLKEFLHLNGQSSVNPHILWEVTKCHIRGVCTSFSSYLSKKRRETLENLENQISSFEAQQKINFTETTQRLLSSARSEHRCLTTAHAEFLHLKTRQKYYEYSERPSKLLALKLKQSEHIASINCIKNYAGDLCTLPSDINLVFTQYYSKLYTSEAPEDHQEIESFLDSLNFPILSDSHFSLLEAPITLKEVEDALVAMPKGKSPGLDGIPPELLSALWHLIGPIVFDSFNFSLDVGSFHRDQKIALISLLLKKGKDPAKCSSYRPLSILNADFKLFAKVLSRRLDSVVPLLLHPDQTGFVKGRMASDNIRRLLHVIDAASEKHPSAILSLDAEKAFDRVEWSFLLAVLKHFGFGPSFIHMVQTLYIDPSARVQTGHPGASDFFLTRGTRQGCPLSPALFALSLEPLALALRQNNVVTPVQIRNRAHYISLYADDILLYLTDITNSLPKVLNLFHTFGSFSGYKINWSKSILMPLHLIPTNLNLPNFPVSIQPQGFTYLGITIKPTISQIIKDNFYSVLIKVKKDFHMWSSLNCGLFGRISTIKMNILPRITFLFSMLPLPPPTTFFKDLESLCRNFIWKGKRARISLSTLSRPKIFGGLALPNFKYYFWSFQLRALKVWLDPSSEVPWRAIENALTYPIRIQDLPFSSVKPKTAKSHMGSIISNTLSIWYCIEKHLSITCKFHSSSPIWHKNALLSGSMPFTFHQWSKQGIKVLGDIFDDQGLRSFQDLTNSYSIPGSSWFFYLQLRTALKTYGVPWDVSLGFHPIIALCSSKSKLVSFLHQACFNWY